MDLKRHKKKVFDGSTTKISVFGVDVDDISLDEAAKMIVNLAGSGQREKYVVTVNAEFVMKAKKDHKFAKILANADIAVADGWWVAFSKLIMGGHAQGRITGVDLIETVCKLSGNKPIGVGFFGGFGGVAAEVAKRQKLASPSLKVVYYGPGDDTTSSNLRLKVPKSLSRRIDILFVALGMGKQEFWIEKWAKKLDVGVFIGVGGAFDYIAGVKKRAPKFLQENGLEWLWRLILEPKRLWRQRTLPIFFLMVMSEIFRQKFFPKKNF